MYVAFGFQIDNVVMLMLPSPVLCSSVTSFILCHFDQSQSPLLKRILMHHLASTLYIQCTCILCVQINQLQNFQLCIKIHAAS